MNVMMQAVVRTAPQSAAPSRSENFRAISSVGRAADESATEAAELDELEVNILMSAVTIARNEQVRSVAALRSRLRQHYPEQDGGIDRALKYWARRVHETRSHERY
jgi:hypothetical protein